MEPSGNGSSIRISSAFARNEGATEICPKDEQQHDNIITSVRSIGQRSFRYNGGREFRDLPT